MPATSCFRGAVGNVFRYMVAQEKPGHVQRLVFDHDPDCAERTKERHVRLSAFDRLERSHEATTLRGRRPQMRVTSIVHGLRQVLPIATGLSQVRLRRMKHDVNGLLRQVKTLFLRRQGVSGDAHPGCRGDDVGHGAAVVVVHCARVWKLVNSVIGQDASKCKPVLVLEEDIPLDNSHGLQVDKHEGSEFATTHWMVAPFVSRT